MTWLHRETIISFHPLLLPLEIFSKPLCSFRTWTVSIFPPHRWIKGLLDREVLPRCGRKRASSDFISFFYPFLFLFALLVCFTFKFWFSLVLCFALLCLTCFCLFIFNFVYFYFYIKKIEKLKNTKTVCVLCTLVLVYLRWPLKQSFLNFVSLVT